VVVNSFYVLRQILCDESFVLSTVVSAKYYCEDLGWLVLSPLCCGVLSKFGVDSFLHESFPVLYMIHFYLFILCTYVLEQGISCHEFIGNSYMFVIVNYLLAQM